MTARTLDKTSVSAFWSKRAPPVDGTSVAFSARLAVGGMFASLCRLPIAPMYLWFNAKSSELGRVLLI